MATFKQPRDVVLVKVYSLECRVSGNMHLVPGKALADMLNMEKRDYVPLTDAELFSPGFTFPPSAENFLGRIPFYGLNTSKIVWIQGGAPPGPPAPALKEVKAILHFQGHVLAGQMWIPSASRITDHFVSTRPFQVLQKARLYPMSEGRQISQLDVAARFDFVTFNSRQAVGVVEG